MALYGCVVVVPDGLMLCAPDAHPHAAGPRRASRPLSAVSRRRRADGMTESLTIVRRLHIVRVCRLARRRNPRPTTPP